MHGEILSSLAVTVLHMFAALFPGVRFLVDSGSGFPDAGGGAYVGSVGCLVSAAMQTAGLYAQSEILTNFQTYFQHFAALCYLCSFCGALLSVGVFGQYTKGLYFLVGPPLFMYMITTTMSVDGTQQQFGGRIVKGSVADQKQFIQKYLQSGTTPGQSAKVSRFFVIFDNIVSSVVQGTVQAMIDTKNNQDLIDKARERVFSFLYKAEPTDAAFKQLVVLGLRGDCAAQYAKLLEIGKQRKDAQKRSIDDDNLNDVGVQLKQQYNTDKTKVVGWLDPKILNLVRSDAQTQEKLKPEKVTCEEAWSYMRIAAVKLAQMRMKSSSIIRDQATDPYVDYDQVEKQTLASAAIDGVPPQEILAAYLIKNALRETTHSALTTSMFNRVPFNAERYAGVYDRAAEVHVFGGQFKLEYFAKAVPYIQGILLYILTMSFPFFAIFLVMPGRATTFLVWCSLWVWVKSWDIGFAIVSIARKIFWLFLKASPAKYAEANLVNKKLAESKPDWLKPETIFALIADNDPLANQNTYFTAIAMLTCAVPLITAHFCMGATNLFDAFKMNLDQTANRFGDLRRRGMMRFMRASPIEEARDETKMKMTEAGARAGMMGTGGLRGSTSGTARGGGGGPLGGNPPPPPPPEKK